MMDGVEVGRVNVAARACGLALRAFELGIEYAQQRVTFGKQISEHQAVLSGWPTWPRRWRLPTR